MSLETSRKVLKISGILAIIFGCLGLLLGILAFAGGTMIAVDGSEEAETAGIALAGGIILLVSGIIALLEGIFSLRAAKDSSKIMPAWIFAILGLISGAGGVISSFSNEESSVGSAIASLAISVLVFVAANTIKKSR